MFWRDRRGNVAVIVALSLPLVIAGAGFGVEVGFWRFDQVRLQQAADAAAYAAAVFKRSGGTSLTDTATTTATSNGYASTTDTLTVNSPSTATPSDANSVEVVIQRTESPYFTGMFTNRATKVQVSATASYSTAADACIIALDHGAAKAVDFAGNSSLTLDGCTVMSDSMASNGLNVQGSAVVTAPCMYSVGGATNGGTTNLTTCTAVKTGQPPVADPYSALTMPTVSGSCQNQGNGATLNPGHYCGLSFNNSKKSFSLNSGVYVIDGGNLDINAGAQVSGSGVTFYLINGASVTMNGNADVNFSPPTDGSTYSGYLFLNGRTNTGSITINGDSTSVTTGIIYSPNGAVNYIGNFSGTGGCTQIVAKTVSWSGSTTFKDACGGIFPTPKIGGVVRLSA